MPRVGLQLAGDLHKLSEELGHPGIEPLWIAVKRRKLAVPKKQVIEYVKSKAEKQTHGAPQRAAGKSISEDNNRWMMDLVDVSSDEIPSGNATFILVCVNVFDRYMYARSLPSKSPEDVAPKLHEILVSAIKMPQFISSDNGTEFGGDVARLLLKADIVQKFKEPGDLNALGLLDRQIGLLKQRLTEMHGRTKKSWATNLQVAVKALNATPKPAVLHGAAPAEVSQNPEVKFMLLQDQARAIQHNKKITEKKTAAVMEGNFRPQLELTKFKRNFQATFGEVHQAAKVEHGRVIATTGASFPLKTVKVVAFPVAAAEAAPVPVRRRLRPLPVAAEEAAPVLRRRLRPLL